MLHAVNLSSHPINQGLVLWSIIELSNDARIVESAINSPQLAVQRNQFMPQVINLDIRVHTKDSFENTTICRVGRPALEAKCIWDLYMKEIIYSIGFFRIIVTSNKIN